MDDADRAQILIDKRLERSLNEVLSHPHEAPLDDEGGNRICVECELIIPVKRLEAVPHAVRCVR